MYSDDEDEEDPLKGFWLEGDSLAPPCQADMEVVGQILSLCRLSEQSILFDLGCGDGRICLEAAKRFHCRAVGVEIEEELVLKFRNYIERMGLGEKVTALHQDLRATDISKATVIVCYLLPEAIELIKSKLEAALLGGALLVCNTWGPKGFQCIQTKQCGMLNSSVTLHVYDKSSVVSSSTSADIYSNALINE